MDDQSINGNRSRRKVIEQELEKKYSNSENVEYYSQRPYTHVIIKYDIYSGEETSMLTVTNLVAQGFAKISGKDTWDQSLGESIALKRAIRDLSHQICDLGYAESVQL